MFRTRVQSQTKASAERKALKNVTHINFTDGPYRQLSCCQVRGMRSIAGIMLERSHLCDRSLVTTSETPRRKARSDGG